MRSFLAEVAEHLVENQAESLQETALIFVNKRPVAYMQQELALLIGKPFWSPSFFTTQEFFALSSEKEIADPYTQFFSLLVEYNRLMQDEGAEALSPDGFYGIAQTILKDFNQVDVELVDARILYSELEDIALIDQQFSHLTDEQQAFLGDFWTSFSPGKQQAQQAIFIRMWRRMPELYDRFHQSLNERGLTTSGQIYRELASGKAGKADFIEKFDKLAFIGFNALSKAESVIFKRWQNEGRAIFYFDTDAYYMQDEIQEAGLFLRKNMGKTGLLNALGPDKHLIRENTKVVNIYKAEGHISQAKLLAASLADDYPLLKQGGQSGRIAIILGDESLLFPVLQTIPSVFPDGSGTPLPVNVTMGFPLLSSGIYGFADLYLTIQDGYLKKQAETVYFKHAESFLSHPMSGLDEAVSGTLKQHILRDSLAEIPAPLLVKAGDLCQLFFTPLTSSLQAITTLYGCFELILYRQLEAGLLQKTDSELLARVLKELNQLTDALTEFADRLSISFVLALIRKVVQSISVPLEGEPLHGIQIMGLLESRALDFEHIYILGVSEGHLPKTSRTPSFIPDSIRRAYGLPVPENQDAISAYMFYRLLQRSVSVSFVYNAQTDQNNTGEPSRFIRQLEFESGYEFRYMQQDQEVALQKKIRFQIPKGKKVMEKLEQYFEKEGSRQISISATALTTYMNCQMQFFFKYVAGLKEPEAIEEGIEAKDIGTIVHAVMEHFYGSLLALDPEITRERIAAGRNSIKAVCRNAYIQEMYGGTSPDPEKVIGVQEIMLAIVEKYVNLILDYDESLCPFTLVELENKNDFQVKYPITLGGKPVNLRLKGIIDRVDQSSGTFRIVDYKTGTDKLTYSSVGELFGSDTHQPNKAMVQTLFYTYIYEKTRGLKGVEPHLYLVKSMGKPGKATTVFKEKGLEKLTLQGETLENAKIEFENALTSKFEELFDVNTSFVQTEIDANCEFCAYVSVCGK